MKLSALPRCNYVRNFMCQEESAHVFCQQIAYSGNGNNLRRFILPHYALFGLINSSHWDDVHKTQSGPRGVLYSRYV